MKVSFQDKEFKDQWEIISRGVVDLLPEDEFKTKLAKSLSENIPLRIKQGFDPTSPDIHLGHTVGIRKLKQFQDLGHQVVLIVGDYTAMVGDPSDRSSTRPQISYDDIMRNAETYQDQFFKILDKSKTEVRFNGEWFKGMEFADVMKLAGKYTVARLLERDDFSKRLKAGTPISIHELFYPLMQAYDSVAINADLEIGATEQKFNLLAGRTIQEAYGKKPQSILTLPILVGTDGEKKMSKSLGNYIGIDESANEIFGKAMSIPDRLITDYYELASDISIDELKDIKNQLKSGSCNPMELKKQLGVKLASMYRGEEAGLEARQEFERVFSNKELPSDMPELDSKALLEMDLNPEKLFLVHLIAKSGMSKSNGEARRLIGSGSVSINGDKISDQNYEFKMAGEMILKVGKRRYLRLLGS